MSDLEKWARETAPTLTDDEWHALETGDGCKSLERFEPDTGYDDALLARVQELADGLSGPMADMLRWCERGTRGFRGLYDCAGIGDHTTARALGRRGLFKAYGIGGHGPFDDEWTFTPLGRAVLRAKGGAA